MVKLHDPISEALDRVDSERPPRGRDDLREVLRDFGFGHPVKGRKGLRLLTDKLKRKPR